jgi:hypothetical protein
VFLRILENLPISRSHKTRAAELAFYYASLRAIRLQNRADWALIGYNGNSFQVATNNETGIARTALGSFGCGAVPNQTARDQIQEIRRATNRPQPHAALTGFCNREGVHSREWAGARPLALGGPSHQISAVGRGCRSVFGGEAH